MKALGLQGGHILQNCFAYHFTPAAFMVEGAAARLGCAVIPAGIGQTELQVNAMAALKPDAYVGTPSFLKIIIEKAREIGADISSVQRALVSAEALPLRCATGSMNMACRRCCSCMPRPISATSPTRP